MTGNFAQLDLFSWPGESGRERQRFRDKALPLPGAVLGPNELRKLSSEALLDLLAAACDLGSEAEIRLLDGIHEVERRDDPVAVPLLLKICHRFAGFDRSRAVPEATAALHALAAIGTRDGAPSILRLLRQGAFGVDATASALDYFTAIGFRPPVDFLEQMLADEHARVRIAACRLAGVTGAPRLLQRLRGLSNDLDREVARAARIARGRLGDGSVKADLEALLRDAVEADMPGLVQALLPLADQATVIGIGRAAERTRTPSVRAAMVEALGQIDMPAAATWVLRCVRDATATVKLAAVDALEDLVDQGADRCALDGLRRLSEDPDGEVAEAAGAALRRRGA